MSMHCLKHLKYKAEYRPSYGCNQCWGMYIKHVRRVVSEINRSHNGKKDILYTGHPLE